VYGMVYELLKLVLLLQMAMTSAGKGIFYSGFSENKVKKQDEG
jgi:hypothetical protein